MYFKSKPFGNVTPLFNTMSDKPQAEEDLPDNFKRLDLPPKTLAGPYIPFKTTCLASRSVVTKEMNVGAEAGGYVPNVVAPSPYIDVN